MANYKAFDEGACFLKGQMEGVAVQQEHSQSRHMAGSNRHKVLVNSPKAGRGGYWHEYTQNGGLVLIASLLAVPLIFSWTHDHFGPCWFSNAPLRLCLRWHDSGARPLSCYPAALRVSTLGWVISFPCFCQTSSHTLSSLRLTLTSYQLLTPFVPLPAPDVAIRLCVLHHFWTAPPHSVRGSHAPSSTHAWGGYEGLTHSLTIYQPIAFLVFPIMPPPSSCQVRGSASQRALNLSCFVISTTATDQPSS